MQFETALTRMRDGYWVYRQAWHRQQWLGLTASPKGGFQFCLNVAAPRSKYSDWEPNYEDLLAEDWEIICQTRKPKMKFETALRAMRNDGWVRRQAWHPFWCLGLVPDVNNKPQFIFASGSDGPSSWEPNHEDLLAEDWEIL